MIVAENISRDFYDRAGRTFEKGKRITVLDQVTFHIPQGEIVGIAGNNGSGKTTLIKMIAGALSPSAGTMHIMGVDPVKRQKSIGKDVVLILASSSNLYPEVTVQDSLELTRKVYGISRELYERRYQ